MRRPADHGSGDSLAAGSDKIYKNEILHEWEELYFSSLVYQKILNLNKEDKFVWLPRKVLKLIEFFLLN